MEQRSGDVEARGEGRGRKGVGPRRESGRREIGVRPRGEGSTFLEWRNCLSTVVFNFLNKILLSYYLEYF